VPTKKASKKEATKKAEENKTKKEQLENLKQPAKSPIIRHDSIEAANKADTGCTSCLVS